MATEVLKRRGTTAEHTSFTGGAGEITVDTTKNTVVVHDGATAGGHPLAKESDLAAVNTDLVNDTTPELGGHLDVGAFNIVTSNSTLILQSDAGNGAIVIDGTLELGFDLDVGAGTIRTGEQTLPLDADSGNGAVVIQCTLELGADMDVGAGTIRTGEATLPIEADSGNGSIVIQGTLELGSDMDTGVGTIRTGEATLPIDINSGTGTLAVSGGISSTDSGNGWSVIANPASAELTMTRDGVNYITATDPTSSLALGAGGTQDHVVIRADGVVTVNEKVQIGGSGLGDSVLEFHDDNNNTWRSIKWDDSSDEFQVEEQGGTMRTLIHSGNFVAGDTKGDYDATASSTSTSWTNFGINRTVSMPEDGEIAVFVAFEMSLNAGTVPAECRLVVDGTTRRTWTRNDDSFELKTYAGSWAVSAGNRSVTMEFRAGNSAAGVKTREVSLLAIGVVT